MKYRILEADDADHLAEMVNRYLEDGWSLQAGVSVALSESDDFKYVVYAQAIVLTGVVFNPIRLSEQAAVKAREH